MSYDEMKLIMREIQLLGLFLIAGEQYRTGWITEDSYERILNSYKEYCQGCLSDSTEGGYGDLYDQTQRIIEE